MTYSIDFRRRVLSLRKKEGLSLIHIFGPEHPTYAAFLPLPNFALGYNETKIIEAAEVIRSIVSGQAVWPTFENGHHITQIVDACMLSSRQRAWVDIPRA